MKISRNVTDVARSSWIRLQIRVYKFLSRFTRRFDDRIVELMIAAQLYSEEGRMALAEAMVAPIRRSLDYQGIGRRLLMVDELPQGAYARYERDPRSTASVRGDDRADAMALAGISFSSGNYYYSNTNMDLISTPEDVAERPATADDIRRVQEQLAQTVNDPNFTITTSSGFPVPVFGHFWSSDIHVSDPYHIREEAALCDYLIWCKEVKTQEKMQERRKQVINPIMEMELGG